MYVKPRTYFSSNLLSFEKSQSKMIQRIIWFPTLMQIQRTCCSKETNFNHHSHAKERSSLFSQALHFTRMKNKQPPLNFALSTLHTAAEARKLRQFSAGSAARHVFFRGSRSDPHAWPKREYLMQNFGLCRQELIAGAAFNIYYAYDRVTSWAEEKKLPRPWTKHKWLNQCDKVFANRAPAKFSP